jgi:two-component system response regulator YesN
MYNIFFVEDDILTRNAALESDIWANNDFRLYGVAANGREAWEQICKMADIDIVITDIRMPYLDGLQLTQLIRSHFPNIKVIILSGFSEFEYARKALTEGVVDYILKPVRFSDLLSPLRKAVAQINAERSSEQERRFLLQQTENAVLVQKSKLFTDILYDSAPVPSLAERAAELGFDLSAKSVIVALIRFVSNMAAQPDHMLSAEIELIAQQLIPKTENTFIINRNGRDLCILFSGDESESLKSLTSSFVAALCDSFKSMKPETSLAIVVGRLSAGIEGIRQSFESAQLLLPLSFLFDNGRVIDLNDSIANQSTRENFSKISTLSAEKDTLKLIIETGTLDDIKPTVSRIVDTVEQSGTSFLRFYSYLAIIEYILFISKKYSSESDMSTKPIDIDEYTFLSEYISSAQTISDYLVSIISEALEIRQTNMRKRDIACINAAKEYIQQNYCSPDLCLTQTADEIGISANHLSTLFGYECGESFTKYVTRLRIEYACELLASTDLNITEISFQSGFSDSNYFSKVFRKKTGEKPLSYRKIRGRKPE